MAGFNAIGRRVLPGVLILLVVVVVVVAASALGSRLLVVRVCVAEHHLGRCFQPASVAGLHLWLFGLFDRYLGSRDTFTHGSSCIALFGHGLISSVVSPLLRVLQSSGFNILIIILISILQSPLHTAYISSFDH